MPNTTRKRQYFSNAKSDHQAIYLLFQNIVRGTHLDCILVSFDWKETDIWLNLKLPPYLSYPSPPRPDDRRALSMIVRGPITSSKSINSVLALCELGARDWQGQWNSCTTRLNTQKWFENKTLIGQLYYLCNMSKPEITNEYLFWYFPSHLSRSFLKINFFNFLTL